MKSEYTDPGCQPTAALVGAAVDADAAAPDAR
jgi:hypothetical protein